MLDLRDLGGRQQNLCCVVIRDNRNHIPFAQSCNGLEGSVFGLLHFIATHRPGFVEHDSNIDRRFGDIPAQFESGKVNFDKRALCCATKQRRVADAGYEANLIIAKAAVLAAIRITYVEVLQGYIR